LTDDVVAEVVRNGFVESVHRGRVVATQPDGAARVEIGAVDAQLFARSAMKPMQTVAMLRAGWEPADDEQVAVACASHSGEPGHIDVVRRLLGAAGLDESALDNTPDLPLDVAVARTLLAAGAGPDRLHQNCSGKHAAMLATCAANGWPVKGYRDPSHPLQLQVRATIVDLTGDDVEHVAVDGCGAPLFSCTLRGLARAFARIAAATDGAELHVADSMRRHPWLVGGTGRDVTALMQSFDGLVAKDGAEGVYAAATRDGRAAALKVTDGTGRARAPVMVAALRKLGVDTPGLDALATVPVLGHGEPVGEVHAVL